MTGWQGAALVTVATLAGSCGLGASPKERAAVTECAQWGEGLNAIVVRAAELAATPDRPQLYARAGRLWQLEHERNIESIVVRDEEAMLVDPNDSIARDRRRAAAFRVTLASHRARVADLDAAITTARRLAEEAGFPELDDDNGAARVLEAGYWRQAAAQAATLQARCRTAPQTLAKGDVATLVLDANAAAHELGGNGHDIASYEVAKRYAAIALTVQK